MEKLSVYIIAYNQEEKLVDALKSVEWADEIIVADSFSTDNTAQIAKEFGAKVVQIPFKGFGSLRNDAITACSHEWIFSLDSDERCTEAAKDEIFNLINNPDSLDAYYVPRRNYFMGKWIRHSGFYPDYRQPQLFRKNVLVFKDDAVHEGYDILSEKPSGYFNSFINQIPYKDLEELIDKANRYSTLGAEKIAKTDKTAGMFKAVTHGFWAAFTLYVLKLGFLDGWPGFIIALGNFEGTFYKYAKFYLKDRGLESLPNRTEPCSIPCNLCNSMDVETLSLKDRNSDYLRTVICKKCGLIWSDPRPTDEKLKEFYSKEYRKEYKNITRPKKKHIYRDAQEAIKRYNFFKEIINRGDDLLDIGAGNGVFVYSMQKFGINARGIEPDENHAQYAREVLDISVITGFAQEINDSTSFNIVTLHHVLEHMIDPLAELKKIWLNIKQNGYLIIEVPNAEDMKQDPKNRYHKAHIYTFNPETVIAIGEKAGFTLFKKKVASFNGNISVIFKKQQDSEYSLNLNDNFFKITKTIHKHTNFSHFTSMMPYKKILWNLFTAVKEQIAVKQFKNDKDIIDTVVLNQIHHQRNTF